MNNNNESLFQLVLFELFRQYPRLWSKDITAETPMRELNLSPMDRVLFKDALNDRFNIAISADDTTTWQVFGDIVEMVDKRTS